MDGRSCSKLRLTSCHLRRRWIGLTEPCFVGGAPHPMIRWGQDGFMLLLQRSFFVLCPLRKWTCYVMLTYSASKLFP